jgi:hypothetical protein
MSLVGVSNHKIDGNSPKLETFVHSPPCLEAAQKSAGEDSVCHATVTGSEATDGTPALFSAVTVYTRA